MRFRRNRHLFPAVLLLVATGCPRAEEVEEMEEVEVVEEVIAAPDTTPAALWAHLQEANYRENWPLWPNKTELYTGQEPHGMLLTTYLNPLALDAVTNRAGRLPAGSIIVKENFGPDSTFAAATVMYKAEGYHPDHNDWFWLKRNDDGTVEAEGRVQMCYGCHAGRADNDYVMTSDIR